MKFGLSINVDAGALLGTSKKANAGFDIGLIDRRKIPVGYVNFDRYDPGLVVDYFVNMVNDPDLTAARVWDVIPDRNFQRCAIDYFSAALKNTQESILGDGEDTNWQPAVGTPICQSQMRDVANTMAGNWFSSAYTGQPTDSSLVYYEGNMLAMGPYNVTPDDRHILSLNPPVVGQEGAYFYSPYPPNSLINPAAKNTGPGAVYCWERLVFQETYLLEGVVLASLAPGGNAVSIEFRAGSPLCAGHAQYPFFTLQSPTTYYR